MERDKLTGFNVMLCSIIMSFLVFLAPLRLYANEGEQMTAGLEDEVESAENQSNKKGVNTDAALELNSESESFNKKYLEGKLEIGTRMSYRYLTNADSGHQGGTYGSGTYLGTIYALDEMQDYYPDKPFVTYYFSRYFGVELAYDSIEAETVAWNTSSDTVKTDGDVSLSGPTVALLARYPYNDKFTPYLGVGLGFLVEILTAILIGRIQIGEPLTETAIWSLMT